jgi:aerotolerance regulator-like protein/VWA domain-containing protein
MSFLSPWFLSGAAAAAVPLVLHLLRRSPEQRVRFAAVALLRHAPVEHTATRRLREIALLLLRVAVIVLLALAFARPFFPAAVVTAAVGVTVVALDTSFSLSAPGRFARARQLAKEAIASAPARDDVAVVTFADQAEVVLRPSADRAAARSAIDAATSGFGATRYRAGLNVAGQMLAGRPGKNVTIVVVTDLQESGWDAGDHASVPESARVEIRDVGALPDNLAVVGVRTDGDRLIASVRNTGARARETRVRLTLDGRAAGETNVSVGPQQTSDASFAGVSGTEAAVAIDDRDGIQADNVRYVLLAGAAKPAVLVVTATGDLDRDAFYVHQALVAGSGSQTFDVAGVSAAQFGGSLVTRVARYAAVLLMSTRGLERHGREALASYVARGGGLLIAAGPDVDGDVIADVLGAGAPLVVVAVPGDKEDKEDRVENVGRVERASQSLAPADVRHPIFQAFGPTVASLGLVRFSRAARISGSGCQTIAKFTSGHAAAIDCGAGEGRAIVLASDLNNRWNDFPRHATFVPFLHETVRYLSSARAHGTEYLVGEVPDGLPATPGIVTIPEARNGGASRARRVVVNVDPRESEPARISVDEFQTAVAHLKDSGAVEAHVAAADQENRQHLWWYLLAGMLAALVAEGVVASRAA